MRQIVINEMRKLPDYITKNKSIPRERKMQKCQGLKNTEAKGNYTKRNISTHNSVEHIDEKWNFVLRRAKLAMRECHDHLDHDDERNER